ncbi:MAG TPA: hypothetical protein VIY52_03430 [Streptosporangiaceae bacterium]
MSLVLPVALGERGAHRGQQQRPLGLADGLDHRRVVQAGGADDLAEAQPGQRGRGHLTGPHDRERGRGQVPAGQRVKLGVDQARAAGLDLHAGSGQLAGQRLGERQLEGLGGGVDGPVRQRLGRQGAAVGQQRCDVDDRP